MRAPTQRILLVRHGETEGESSIRFHGSTDVQLSDLGRAQAHAARLRLPIDRFELVVASPLARAWQSAQIIAPKGAPIQLEEGFREIDFGLWEGLTKDEIEASNPALYRQWQADPASFEFPQGEKKAAFRARVAAGVARVLGPRVPSVLVVAHKGVIKAISEILSGETIPQPHPELGAIIALKREGGDRWSWRHV